jgi:hypothetical protein
MLVQPLGVAFMVQHSHKVAAGIVICLIAIIAEGAGEDTKTQTDNANSVMKGFQGKLKFSCSSSYTSWGPEKLFDGKPTTSWFSGSGDSVAHGKTPWVAVEFPMAVTVRRVTLLTNREPSYPTGYTILAGRLELLDTEGKVVFSGDDKLGPKRPDMDIRTRMPIRGVYMIRFTSLKDEGDKNGSRDVALGEMLVE